MSIAVIIIPTVSMIGNNGQINEAASICDGSVSDDRTTLFSGRITLLILTSVPKHSAGISALTLYIPNTYDASEKAVFPSMSILPSLRDNVGLEEK